MKDIIFCWMLYAEEEKSFISVHYMWASSFAFSPVTMVTAMFDCVCVCVCTSFDFVCLMDWNCH